MRFSIKWLLAAMAYVALAAAAIGTHSTLLATLVWTLTIVAALYASILVTNSMGEQRWRATGFAIFVAAYIAGMFAAFTTVPASQLFQLAGYNVNRDGTLYVWMDAGHTNFDSLPEIATSLRTANAVCAMLAGLFGCGLGGLAYRRRPDE